MTLQPRVLLGLAVLAAGGAVRAADKVDQVEPSEPSVLRDATFEELGGLTISAVSKAAEDFFRSAAAGAVITAEDIRRSGALTLPEVLRLAPGVEVGQYNSRSYALTVRGFNGTSATKLLPLIDGRSLYSARFGGTIWDVRDVPLEDVEQIEVVGGPGGTTWGTNAVNGVVNIITKSARQTQGTQVAVGGGVYEQAFAYVREGVQTGPDAWLRVYAKAFSRGETEPGLGGTEVNDAWRQYRSGFRFDHEPSTAAHTVVTGDVFFSDADQLIGGRADVAKASGGHLLARRERELDPDSRLSLQVYYDRVDRDSASNVSSADVLDAEARHEFAPGERQHLSWGGNVRVSRLEDKVRTASGFIRVMPDVRYLKQGALFVQDTISLAPDTWTATLGLRAEYNDFTGVEALPSARLAWTPSDRLTVWGAYSRAVRIPSRFENDQSSELAIFGQTFRTIPSREVDSETLDAFEAGARRRVSTWLTAGASVYFNHYHDLITGETVAGGAPGLFVTEFGNLAEGNSWGGEFSATAEATEWWRLIFTWSAIRIDIDSDPRSTDGSLPPIADKSPAHQLGLRSLWNLGRTWEADAWLRWVDELPDTRPVPAYTSLDLRLGKQLGRGWEVSLVARNLLEPSRPEFIFSSLRSEVPRSVYLRVDWRR